MLGKRFRSREMRIEFRARLGLLEFCKVTDSGHPPVYRWRDHLAQTQPFRRLGLLSFDGLGVGRAWRNGEVS